MIGKIVLPILMGAAFLFVGISNQAPVASEPSSGPVLELREPAPLRAGDRIPLIRPTWFVVVEGKKDPCIGQPGWVFYAQHASGVGFLILPMERLGQAKPLPTTGNLDPCPYGVRVRGIPTFLRDQKKP